MCAGDPVVLADPLAGRSRARWAAAKRSPCQEISGAVCWMRWVARSVRCLPDPSGPCAAWSRSSGPRGPAPSSAADSGTGPRRVPQWLPRPLSRLSRQLRAPGRGLSSHGQYGSGAGGSRICGCRRRRLPARARDRILGPGAAPRSADDARPINLYDATGLERMPHQGAGRPQPAIPRCRRVARRGGLARAVLGRADRAR